MTTPDGKDVLFFGACEYRTTFQWSIALFLRVAHESRTFEEFKATLLNEGALHKHRPVIAVAAGAK